MFYYKVIGYGSCPWCQRANSLLLQEKLPFVACWIENSWALVHHYKTIYGMETVPVVLKVDFETGEEHVIGGFTELKEYIDQGLHEEGDKETE
jgi:glutaredoxin